MSGEGETAKSTRTLTTINIQGIRLDLLPTGSPVKDFFLSVAHTCGSSGKRTRNIVAVDWAASLDSRESLCLAKSELGLSRRVVHLIVRRQGVLFLVGRVHVGRD